MAKRDETKHSERALNHYAAHHHQIFPNCSQNLKKLLKRPYSPLLSFKYLHFYYTFKVLLLIFYASFFYFLFFMLLV